MNSRVEILFFYLPWCVQSAMLERTLAAVGGGRVTGRVNMEEAEGVAKAFGVYQAPTLLRVASGEELGRLEGVQPPEIVSAWLGEAQV